MDPRERTKELAAEFAENGDATGWFEALYKEAAGDTERIPWADLEPNRFFADFAAKTQLEGNGRSALVVGCGLGDDAKLLSQLNFNVTAFDISRTAIDWAKKLNQDTDIKFFAVDLFDPPKEWYRAFEFVLEIYTIQPLPLELRPKVIDAVSNFVKEDGKLVAVARGRENGEEVGQLPWPLSRDDLSRFEVNGLTEESFDDFVDDEDVRRFVVQYSRLIRNCKLKIKN